MFSSASQPGQPGNGFDASQYSLLGNPYPCEISFIAFRAANSSVISNSYWTFFSSSNQASVSNYSVYNNGASVNFPSAITNPGIISSGQAFLVEKQTAGPGSVQFLESHKSGVVQNGLFRLEGAGNYVRIGMKQDTTRFDEIVIRFKPDGINTLDKEYDALSLNTGNQVISSLKGLKKLAIQTRNLNFINDTVDLSVISVNTGTFQLNFSEFENFSGTQIYLMDSFLNTVTFINDNSVYNFNITANPASKGDSRFKVVFTSLNVLPVDVFEVKAYKKNTDIEIGWTALAQTNVKQYEVEKSANGQHFKTVATFAAENNNISALSYNWLDVNAFEGTNYYRVKRIKVNGNIKYSQICKVTATLRGPDFVVYPNAIKNNLLTIKISNSEKGSYRLSLFNSVRQEVCREMFQLLNQPANHVIKLPSNLSKGTYYLKIKQDKKSVERTLYVEKL